MARSAVITWLLLLLAADAPARCVAPSGRPVLGALAGRKRQTVEHPSTYFGGAAAMGVAAAAAAYALFGKNRSQHIPPHIVDGDDAAELSSKTGKGRPTAGPSWYDSEGESADSDACDYCSGGDDGGESGGDDSDGESDGESRGGATMTGSRNGKLWTKAQFPEGTKGQANWEIANLQAAQAWECPCADRFNCIGEERLSFLKLYEYRKSWQTTAAPAGGGMRDMARQELEGHYDKAAGMFTRSFVVGPVGDCCAPSSGLAKGLAFATWANSRADVTLARPMGPGRAKTKQEVETKERAHLSAWLRSRMTGFEGPKVRAPAPSLLRPSPVPFDSPPPVPSTLASPGRAGWLRPRTQVAHKLQVRCAVVGRVQGRARERCAADDWFTATLGGPSEDEPHCPGEGQGSRQVRRVRYAVVGEGLD